MNLSVALRFKLYLMGDQAGVENWPLMQPTSLSISSFSSWYSFTSVREGTATCGHKAFVTVIHGSSLTCRSRTFPIHFGYFTKSL